MAQVTMLDQKDFHELEDANLNVDQVALCFYLHSQSIIPKLSF